MVGVQDPLLLGDGIGFLRIERVSQVRILSRQTSSKAKTCQLGSKT
jgi:hypothetical protein